MNNYTADQSAEFSHDWVSILTFVGRAIGSFVEMRRLVSFNVETTKFAHGPTHVVVGVEVTDNPRSKPRQSGDALYGHAHVSLGVWTNDEAMVDTLGPVEWRISRAGQVAEITGTDPNLGAAKVATYNNSLFGRSVTEHP